jgi:hypothetical protein
MGPNIITFLMDITISHLFRKFDAPSRVSVGSGTWAFRKIYKSGIPEKQQEPKWQKKERH